MGFSSRVSILTLLVASMQSASAGSGGDTLILMGAPLGFGSNSNLEVALLGAKAGGGRVTTAGFSGKTLTSGTLLDLPLMNREDFVKAIRLAVSRMQGNSLTIYFNGHAGPVRNDLNRAQIGFSTEYTSKVPAVIASQTTVLAPLEKLNYLEIGEILDAEIPKSKTIKLVIESCFAGCVHVLSTKSDRICSASATDYLTPLYVYPEFWASPYTHDFWELHRRRPSASLYELHSEAMSTDSKNGPRALLSSESYVDSILKEGSFSPRRQPGWKESVIYGIPRSIFGFGAGRFEDREVLPPNATAEQLMQRLDQEAWAFEEAIRSAYGNLPLVIDRLNYFHAGKWKQARSVILRELGTIAASEAKQRQVWEGSSPAEKTRKSLSHSRQISQLKTRRDEILNELRDFEKSMQRASAVERFLKVASSAQKEKYLRLLKCELEPL